MRLDWLGLGQCYDVYSDTESFESITKLFVLLQVKLNPSEVIQESASIDGFLNYLDPFMVPQSVQQQLPPSDVVGNIRFSHPTLYVFPGGQGDSALFGINGFNLLVDGGFSRKACFWDFSRHLDRLDAILITRMSDDNSGGMSALLQRKTMSAVYPQIGHVFANLPHSEKLSEIGQKGDDKDDEDEDSLLINVIEEGNSMLQSLQILNLQPQVCLRDRDNAYKPINLYHKVGHGKLDMYVINPSRDAKEIREFMERWNGENSKSLGTFKSGINVDGKELWLPLANLVSICALLVWFPDNPDDTITRLLFPGSTPQNKVLRGLEKLKDLEFMQKPVCASRSMRQTSQASATEKKEAMKQAFKMSAASRSRDTQSVKAEKADVSSKKMSSTSSLRSERTRQRLDESAKPPRSPKRKAEDKAQKERKNQAAGQQIKEKASVLKREKPLTSIKGSSSGRSVTSDRPSTSSTARRVPRTGGPPPSKTKKEASNKTKKEEVTRSSKAAAQKKKSEKASSVQHVVSTEEKIEDGEQQRKRSVIEGLAAVVNTATCAAAVVMGEPLQQMEDEVESIVEKHQLEEMERTSNVQKETEEDDIEPELQRIKDEEDIHEQEAREPDIPVAAALPPLNLEEKVPVVQSAKNAPVHIATTSAAPVTHVKTPDEVEDLPEHEAVEPVIPQDVTPVEEELSPAEEMEKKIALDLQEKETSVEKEKLAADEEKANREKEVSAKTEERPGEKDDKLSPPNVEDIVSPESEGAQQQRELSELIVSAQQALPEKAASSLGSNEYKVHVDKLKEVLATIISYYEDELKSSKSGDERLNDEIGVHLEKSINLLSTLNSDATPDDSELTKTKNVCISTIDLVRKCMKLAIELIETETEGSKSFMEYLHCEPDLILHCQEIENFCNSMLPSPATEKPGESLNKAESKDIDEAEESSATSDKKDDDLKILDKNVTEPQNVQADETDLGKETGNFIYTDTHHIMHQPHNSTHQGSKEINYYFEVLHLFVSHFS